MIINTLLLFGSITYFHVIFLLSFLHFAIDIFKEYFINFIIFEISAFLLLYSLCIQLEILKFGFALRILHTTLFFVGEMGADIVLFLLLLLVKCKQTHFFFSTRVILFGIVGLSKIFL